MTQLVRVPLAWPIGTRSGTSLVKDPYIKNGVLEKYGDKMMVAKRPGTEDFLSLGFLALFPNSQGATYYNGYFFGIASDSLWRNGGVSAASTGVTWTQSSTPAWAPTEFQGAAVFNNRMFMLGGFTSDAGIWSSSDGITWTVNAGGQPWGLRGDMAVVVLNNPNQMLVLGGLNLTLGTVFNDVWATSDGTNWTCISKAGDTPWPARNLHGAVSTPNGVYLMGGLDSVSGPTVYYNDVWFSPDGSSTDATTTTWAKLLDNAPWSARYGFSCLYFANKIWVIGGIDSVGTVLNDVWSSPDGITWTQTTTTAFLSGRSYMYSCVYLDKMWIIGGTTGSGVSADVYQSDDGATWTFMTGAPGFTARTSGQALVFRTPDSVSPYNYPTMWLLGGDDGGSTLGEVWYGDLDAPVFTFMSLNVVNAGEQFQFATFLNNTKLVFKNSTNMFVFDGYLPVPVTDTNYPAHTVPGIVTLNGRLYVMTPQGEIHGSSLENPLLWPVLDFVTADYEDDAGVALAKYLNYVVAFGTYTTQFFYDNGANQPVGSVLAPYINANLRVGCVSAKSVATCGNALYWVGQGDQAGRGVYTFNGLNPVKMSTPYIDRILMQTDPDDMNGIPAVCDGREYYVLKTGFDTALAYDITDKEWYEWDTFPYLGYVTDFTTTGDYLYTMLHNQLKRFSPSVYTDAVSGDFTLQVLCDKEDHGNTARKFFGSAVLVGDQVTGAEPFISASDDDYNTYTIFGTVNMGNSRPRITRLGSARRRSWRVSQTDNLAARWEALEVEYSQGES